MRALPVGGVGVGVKAVAAHDVLWMCLSIGWWRSDRNHIRMYRHADQPTSYVPATPP